MEPPKSVEKTEEFVSTNKIEQQIASQIHPVGSDSNVARYELSINYKDAELQSTNKYPNNFIKTSKYTIATFLPLNLYGQFKRYYNLYFLLGACLTALGDLVPIEPWLQVVPLVAVVGVTLVKDGIEDYKRHVSDREANNVECIIVKDGKAVVVRSRDIVPGDILFLKKGEKVPADIILLSSSSNEGACFIETSELDGETNLKRKQIIEEVTGLVETPEKLSSLKGKVQCDPPNENLNAFTGRLILYTKEPKDEASSVMHPLSHQQAVFRGSRIRNTDYVYGVVVYAGVDTKIFKNLKNTGFKFSSLEKRINQSVLYVLIFKLIVLFISSGMSSSFQGSVGIKSWYLRSTESAAENFLLSLPGFFIIFTYMVPLSLFVSIEVVRLAQAEIVAVDDEMKVESGPSASVRNSNLNEDLACVDYIFSDKTGTLTQNEMQVTHWYIRNAGIMEEGEGKGILQKELEKSELSVEKRQEIEFFLKHVSLCHTVLPASDDSRKNVPYEAPSPDELALLLGLKKNGILLKKRTKSLIQLEYFDGSIKEYKILQVLEFNSDRKRMSIIVESESGIELFCKGADSFVLRLLSPSESKSTIEEFQKSIDEFAQLGLRTLAVAYRKISMDDYLDFANKYSTAEKSLVDREEKVNKACEIIEKNLSLLGASAIEDRLQEGVPETLEYLIECGIKIWLLTGDKQETAVNIGLSSKLIPQGATLIKLNIESEKDADLKINEFLNFVKQAPRNSMRFSLVIDGFSLTFILPKFQKNLLELSQYCETVICCRVTPIQKALVVRLVKDNIKKVCLSIGDGANDVSMIQAANIGVGLMGKEGGQAARAIHGRYSNLRIAKLILYSLYKNLAMIMVFFWYCNFQGWSGEPIYNTRFLSFFNVIFTSLAPLALAIFEKDVSEKSIGKYPKLYAQIRSGVNFHNGLLLGILGSSILHSLIIFALSYGMLQESDLSVDQFQLGFLGSHLLLSTMTFLTVYYKFLLMENYWVIPISGAVVVSSIAYIGNMFWYWNDTSYEEYYLANMVNSSANYWLGILLVPFISNFPDLMYCYYQRTIKPTDSQIIQEEELFSKMLVE